jgi:hypothetical protein
VKHAVSTHSETIGIGIGVYYRRLSKADSDSGLTSQVGIAVRLMGFKG